MASLRVPRILLAGAARGAGVSLLGIGVITALRRRGIATAACVVGPNMNQAALYRRLTSNFVNTLDQRLLSKSQLQSSLYLSGLGTDFILIEGSDGLYDSVENSALVGSAAEIAALTRTPALLALDCAGWKYGIVPVIKGFKDLARGFNLAGVIANRVGQEFDYKDHAKILDDSLVSAGLEPLLGKYPKLSEVNFQSVRQVTEKINCSLVPSGFPEKLASLAEQHINLDKLIQISEQIELVQLEKNLETTQRRARIAFPTDSAFTLGFQDNLNWLRFYGAELVPFSPMTDLELPKNIGGLYMCGGAFADYAKNLVENKSLRSSIKNFFKRGGPIYSEGGGTAYLCDGFQFLDDGPVFEGVGVISGVARMQATYVSYVEAVTFEDSVLGWPGLILKGVSSDEWSLSSPQNIVKTFRVSSDSGESTLEGFSPGAQVLSTFCFFHWGSNTLAAKNFVDAAQGFQTGAGPS